MLLLRSPRAAVATATAGVLAAKLHSETPAFAQSARIHFRYFDARGVLETSRIMLALKGVPFTDDRFKVTMRSGAPYSPTFEAIKVRILLRTTCRQLALKSAPVAEPTVLTSPRQAAR